LIGPLFSRNKKQEEKRNVIIFVRPQIIHSFEEYKKITQNQEDVFREQANPVDFSEALQILPPVE
jgi:type III secretion protein C